MYHPSSSIKIEVYCDASCAPDEEHRKSRSGWFVLINGSPVAWKSGLQPIIAHSTSESEYISMSDAVREAMSIASLISELGYTVSGPITVHEDNMTAITIASEIATKRSKHIDIRYHHIKQLVKSRAIKIVYCPSSDQIADILTKALPKDSFCKLRDRFMAKGVQEQSRYNLSVIPIHLYSIHSSHCLVTSCQSTPIYQHTASPGGRHISTTSSRTKSPCHDGYHGTTVLSRSHPSRRLH